MAMPLIKEKTFPIKRGGNYYIEFKGEKFMLPAVTTILQESLPKPQLMEWGMRKSSEIALKDPGQSIDQVLRGVYSIRDSAGELGRLVHSWAEAYGNGFTLDPETTPQQYRGYFRAFAQFSIDHKPKVIHTECTVFNLTHQYAGTADNIAFLFNDIPVLIDYKTGKGIYFDAHLQQVAYANAEYIMLKDKSIIEMPKLERKYLLHLQPDGNYTLVPVRDRLTLDDWLTVVNFWKLLKREKEFI